MGKLVGVDVGNIAAVEVKTLLTPEVGIGVSADLHTNSQFWGKASLTAGFMPISLRGTKV